MGLVEAVWPVYSFTKGKGLLDQWQVRPCQASCEGDGGGQEDEVLAYPVPSLRKVSLAFPRLILPACFLLHLCTASPALPARHCSSGQHRACQRGGECRWQRPGRAPACLALVCEQARLASLVVMLGVLWVLSSHSPDLAHLKDEAAKAHDSFVHYMVRWGRGGRA